MPIITKPIVPFIDPPYRGKINKAGGLRDPKDYSQVMLHLENNCKHLFCHQQSSFDEVILEVHNQFNECNQKELEFCSFESFELTKQQRFDLAVYLLSTV